MNVVYIMWVWPVLMVCVQPEGLEIVGIVFTTRAVRIVVLKIRYTVTTIRKD